MTIESKTAKARRPRDKRVQLTIRIDPDLLAKLEEAAEDRMVAKDLIIGKAIETFLDRLLPATRALADPTGADKPASFEPRRIVDNPQA